MKTLRSVFVLVLPLAVVFACSSKTYHTVEVKKPRYHHSWYKHHTYHKKIGVGRIRVRLFEKQGTKTVKMKG